MKVGDLVTTIEPALGPTGDDFGAVIVIGKRTINNEEDDNNFIENKNKILTS